MWLVNGRTGSWNKLLSYVLSLTEYAFLSANASPYKIINHKMPNAGNLGMAGTALRLYRHIHSSEEPSEGESLSALLSLHSLENWDADWRTLTDYPWLVVGKARLWLLMVSIMPAARKLLVTAELPFAYLYHGDNGASSACAGYLL